MSEACTRRYGSSTTLLACQQQQAQLQQSDAHRFGWTSSSAAVGPSHGLGQVQRSAVRCTGPCPQTDIAGVCMSSGDACHYTNPPLRRRLASTMSCARGSRRCAPLPPLAALSCLRNASMALLMAQGRCLLPGVPGQANQRHGMQNGRHS